jgi:putative transposase
MTNDRKQIGYKLRIDQWVNPQFGIAKLIRYMKGRSSRYLRQEFPWLKSRLPTLWTNSYFISTVGGAPISVVKQYIEDQKNV